MAHVLCLPVVACAQCSDVRGVVAPVPCVDGQGRRQVLPAAFGVNESALKIGFAHGFKQRNPALMHGADKASASNRWAAICCQRAGPRRFRRMA